MSRQRETLIFYQVKCDSAKCGKTYFEWHESLGKCPHCGERLDEDNVGVPYDAIFEIDPFTGEIVQVGYKSYTDGIAEDNTQA